MPIINPYAKQNRKGSGQSNNQSNSNNATAPAAATATVATTAPCIASTVAPTQQQYRSSLHSTVVPAATGRRTSFSQSFGPIEDEVSYQTAAAAAAAALASAGESVAAAREERAAQRALDREEQQENGIVTAGTEAAAAAATNNLPMNAPQQLSDRDHHVTLQQPHVLYVSDKQRGNGVLQYILNVPWQYSRMVPDYILSTTRCALFLSIKYHLRHPTYISRRIAELKTDFELRILLVLVDIEDNAKPLLELNKLAVVNNLTLILAWSEPEAARYLETYKAFDGKDASLIQKREQTNFLDQVTDFLTTLRAVNRTDAGQMIAQFRTMRSLMMASSEELALVPGMGEVKVKRLYDAFQKPFSSRAARKRKKMKEEVIVANVTVELAEPNAAETGKEEDLKLKQDVEERNEANAKNESEVADQSGTGDKQGDIEETAT